VSVVFSSCRRWWWSEDDDKTDESPRSNSATAAATTRKSRVEKKDDSKEGRGTSIILRDLQEKEEAEVEKDTEKGCFFLKFFWPAS